MAILVRHTKIYIKYLDSLQDWLSKWRMKTAAHKCSYNIFTEHGHSKKEIHLEIFGKKINKENITRYLGIYKRSKRELQPSHQRNESKMREKTQLH